MSEAMPPVPTGFVPITDSDTSTSLQQTSQSTASQPQEKIIHGGFRWLLMIALVCLGGYLGIQILATVIFMLTAFIAQLNLPQNTLIEYSLLLAQLTTVVIGLPLYRYLRLINSRRPIVFKDKKTWLDSVLARKDWQGSVSKKIIDVISIIVIGIALQLVISAALTLIEPFIPKLMGEYSELMEQVFDTNWTSIIALVVMAPISEEIFFRGVALEYARRSSTKLWFVVVAQALAFGIAHGNLVQGTYAFVVGAVLGLICLRVGGLPTSIIGHFAVNASSFFVGYFLNPAMRLGEKYLGGGDIGLMLILLVFAAVGIVSYRVLVKRSAQDQQTPLKLDI
ncbi:CPBP family intramembrane glutamic endopeptidase [Atopobium sp. oral taxon 810]|uniref:CPBP family intramembrane glutamic endopeptidase n=1 Tax=Atopobium sp. oral taxon 810 TaxID=712158 RepID=UPI000396ABDA|nr:CPBP family intramembrane glutamic endopeptidase [Atopobium sp. oral taxon 810]ERI03818.1 CAAX amino terminal protease family protein [Atopobium sp. oral taxon 810 str. F0209]